MAMAEGEEQQGWRYEPRKNDPEEVNKSVFVVLPTPMSSAVYLVRYRCYSPI